MAVDTTQAARKKMTMATAQENLYSYNVARRIFEVNTKDMGTIYNPYTSIPATNVGTVTTPTYSIGTYAADADSLQVNLRADASEHVNSYDWKSVGFGLIADRGANYGRAISQIIDRSALNSVVGNGGFALGNGGTDGSTTPWTTSNTNIDDVVNAVVQQIDANDGHGKKKFLVVSPYEANDLRSFMQNNGQSVADKAIVNGIPFVGTTFSGVDIYQTNNISSSAVLTIATTPTDGDTVTINGVVFTFKTTIGSTAGNVAIGGSADAARLNLSELINAPDTTDAGQVALSVADQAKLASLSAVAVDAASPNTLTLTASGSLIVSETLTDATDAWGSVSRYLIGGNYGAGYLALPTQGMDYTEKEVSAKAGVELYMEQFFNHTIWTRMVPQIGTVLVN